MTSLIQRARDIVALKDSIGAGNLATSELMRADEQVDCPACNGEGCVDVDTYTNFDDRSVGVQFYGVGPDFGRYEKLYEYGIQSAPALAAALVETEAELRKLKHAYIGLMETGYELIIELGGECDDVEMMSFSDPTLRSVNALLTRLDQEVKG